MMRALCDRVAQHSGETVIPLESLASERSVVVKVLFGGRPAVLTQRITDGLQTFVDIHREIASHLLAAVHDLAPNVFWHSEALGVLVCEWVASSSGFSDNEIERIGAQLARLHALGFQDAIRAPTLVDAAVMYSAAVSSQSSSALACQLLCDEICTLQETASQEPFVFSHRDPGPGNIVGERTPLLVDWEYAGPATRAFDLAATIEANALAEGAQRLLLRGYASVAGTPPINAAIVRERATFKALTQLWRAALPAVTQFP